MKKKELLGLKQLKATKEMIQVAKTDVTEKEIKVYTYGGHSWKETVTKCKHCRYFMAVAEGEILKVAMFTRDRLQREIIEPLYEIYVNKKENAYLTYEPSTEKWRTAKINMLEFKGICSMHTEKEWQTSKTRKLVNEYFETGKNLNVFQAVLDFQSEVKHEALMRKYRSEIEQIDATMKEVPELPKGFDAWIIKNCFKETLFYEREKPYKWPKVYCTHCGKWMDAPGKPKHGEEIKCPSCGVDAVYRSWNKQKYVDDVTDVAILQKLMDGSGYILRSFECRIKRRHDKGWENMEFSKFENVRARLNMDFLECELFEWGEYKYTGLIRWRHQCRRSAFGYYNYTFGRTLMYTANLKRELRDRVFKNMDLKTLFKGGTRKRVDAEYLLQRLERYPFLEYLQKSGLNNLVDEIMDAKEQEILFDKTKQRINDVLKLDKQRFNRLRKWDGNCNVLRALQYEQRTGQKLPDKNIEYIIENKVDIGEVQSIMNRTGMNIQRTLNYIKRQQEDTGFKFRETLRYYVDYLDMAEERGMDLHDEIVCKQPRMMEYHNRYLEEKNRAADKKRNQEVDKKFPNIKKNYEKNVDRFLFETKDYVIVVPKKASDITREGKRQHHCVGASDTYMRKMDNEQTFIIFLRRKKNKLTPYYTLEVDWNGKVIQWYSAYDRKPDEEVIGKVLDQWRKQIEKRENELQKKQEETAEKLNLKIVGRDRSVAYMAAAI